MKLSGQTKVHELVTTHPFLEDFLAGYHPKFEMLRNRMARATIGRIATLRVAAGIASIELADLLRALASEIERQTGTGPELELEAGATVPGRAERIETLRSIIGELHQGGDLEQAKARFSEAVGDVEASEIAAMEEELIRGGLPVSEVQRLCDVHVGAFRQALDEHADAQTPPGHPIDTYRADNVVITRLANELGEMARQLADGADAAFDRAAPLLGELWGVENHYQRKENQLFALLERHGVSGPSKVMWGVHDLIRASLAKVRAAIASRDRAAVADAAPALARDLVEMVYKEEKILFPMALETLTEQEWVELRRGEDELGYVLARPAAAWPATGAAPSAPSRPQAAPAPEAAVAGTVAEGGLMELKTGLLSIEQLNLVFSHLPVDVSFVDEQDTVRFYSEGPERIFPRSPAVIGRKVQNCHPPKSLHMVQDILDSFREGRQSRAEFWLQLQGKFIHIRYVALRAPTGAYRGCLEITQDVTAIRALEGQRRILEWDSRAAGSAQAPAS